MLRRKYLLDKGFGIVFVAQQASDGTATSLAKFLKSFGGPSHHNGPHWLAKIELQPFSTRNFHAAVIEAEEIENRGVHVSHIVPMFGGVEAQFVRRAMNDAALDAAAGEHSRT